MFLPKLLLLALCVSVAVAGSHSSSSSSSEETKIKNKRGKCTEVVERPPSGDCILIESLKKILEKIEIDAKIKLEFQALITTINTKIILNEAYSALDIFVLASYRLKTFLLKYEAILAQIEYLEIGTWGSVHDLFVISTEIKGETAESLIVAEVGAKTEIVIVLEQISVFLSEELQEIVGQIVADLDVVFVGTLPYPKKMAQIGKIFKKFIKEYPGLAFIPSLKIGKWGSFAEFFDVTAQYERIELIPEVVKRVPDGDHKVVSLILELEASLTVASYKWTKLERKVLRMFFASLKYETLAESLSEQQIVKIVSTHFLELVKIEPSLLARLRGIQIGGESGFGTFGNLIDLFVFLSLENAKLSTIAPSSTVSGITVSSETTSSGDPEPTTEAVESTPEVTESSTQSAGPTDVTEPPLKGDCAAAETEKLVIIPAGGNANQTIIISSYYGASDAWENEMIRLNFQVFIHQVATKIIANSAVPPSEKIAKVVSLLEEFVASDELRRQLVMGIVIQGWGTNDQLIKCE